MPNTANFAMITNNIPLTATKIITMETLQYKIIKTDAQYNRYCETLEALVDSGKKAKAVQDEIELLTLLIDKYDAEHNTFDDADPIELLKSLMKDHKMKAVDLANLLNVSEGLVSDMLNYKKGLSKDTIRILSERFKLNQEAFNRPYELHVPVNAKFKDARMMNSRKKLATAS
jgi:HTH-type transcriptional regulator/antitoxin HigA